MPQPPRVSQPPGPRNPPDPRRPPGTAPTPEPMRPAGMLLRPRRPPPLVLPSPTDPMGEMLPPAEDAPGTPPRAVALALRQVLRTPAKCPRCYKFLKNKVPKATGQAPGPLDAQIHELMGLLGDDGPDERARRRPAGPGCPQHGRHPAPSAPAPALDEPGRQAAAGEGKGRQGKGGGVGGGGRLGLEAGRGGRGRRVRGRRVGCSTDPALPPAAAASPWAPANLLPSAATPSLNAALLQTLTHLGNIVGMLGLLRDQLLTRNQHVEQLPGSFDQTLSLALGFILGSVATLCGILGKPS
ncbi:undifferentiated embryonic cell transcription factor 1-like [Dipodomys merriami]|uniref:undifferentiated embryonic cell transcription factor 1-like n=1 Tax=Dipodomys merriami TaxID=94247 RepID=UPI00384F5CDD